MPSLTEKLDEILAQAENATAGPWVHEGFFSPYWSDQRLRPITDDRYQTTAGLPQLKHDLRFCAASRENVPRLARALKLAVQSLEYVNRNFKNPMPEYACMDCDMGGSGYSTKGDGWHDDKAPHTCVHVEVYKALAAIEKELEGKP